MMTMPLLGELAGEDKPTDPRDDEIHRLRTLVLKMSRRPLAADEPNKPDETNLQRKLDSVVEDLYAGRVPMRDVDRISDAASRAKADQGVRRILAMA